MSKTKKYVILSSIITALCLTFICVKTEPVKAYTKVTSGVFSIQTHVVYDSYNGVELIITCNFDDYYSGYIGWTLYNPYSVDISYYAINTYLYNMTSTGFYTSFEKCNYFEVHIFYDRPALQDALYNAGKIAAASFTYLVNYLTNNWESYCDVKTISYSSGNLSVDSPEDDILSEVQSIDTNIEGLIPYIDQIETLLTTTNLTLQAINNTLLTLSTDSNSGAFAWDPYQVQFILKLGVMGANWDTSILAGLPVAKIPIAWTEISSEDSYVVKANNTLHIIYYSNSASAYHLAEEYSSLADYCYGYNCEVVSNNAGILLMHVYINNDTDNAFTAWWRQANGDQWFYPLYWGYEIPDELYSILGQESKSNSLLQGIINAINGITLTVENDTEINNYVNANDNSITTITNDHETVNNITNDFNIDFGTADNAITLDLDTLPDLTNTATFWNGKAGDLDVELGDFHYPIWLGFVLLVIMAMIGV